MRARIPALVTALAALALALGAIAPACSLQEGTGAMTGTLNDPECWQGKFDLQPDFFAALPYRQTLQIRIQRGSDYETFSDGALILIDDITHIRPADDGSSPGMYNVPLAVGLPAGVAPPGVPLTANPQPSLVHFVLYLGRSCRTQNLAFYAMDQVQLNADGTCDAVDGGGASLACDAGTAAADAGVPAADAGASGALPIGRSTITFQSLFDGNPDEEIAAKRLSQGTFHVYLADPRDICPGGLGPPPPCKGELTGNFSFYFQRGRPAQPFP